MVKNSTAHGTQFTKQPLRPYGRSLRDFEPLSPAEKTLLDCCRQGEFAIIGEARPDKETEANRVRADFVRFLALGGDERAPVHEHGVQLFGAWLTNVLQLTAARVPRRMALWHCWIERIEAGQTSFELLSLSGTRLKGGLLGDRLHCEGSFFMNDGFHASGEVRLLGANIGGNLDCRAGLFENPSGDALSCDGSVISGSIIAAGCHAKGNVRLHAVTIGGDLDVRGGLLETPGRHALSGDGANVSGSIYLSQGFRAVGQVRLVAAVSGGDVDLTNGRFEHSKDVALDCDRLHVRGRLFLSSLVALSGVDMSLAYVGTLCDDFVSWAGAKGRVVLDGFTYGRLAGIAPVDAGTRIDWLRLQVPTHLGEEFRPQPWEQVTIALRAMGHPDEARAVAVAKQDHLRRAGKMAAGARMFHWAYGALIGYGYMPWRLIRLMSLVWLFCGLVYWWAANPGPLGPSSYLIAPAGKEANPRRPDYANFVPLFYSADVLLPVIDLGYKDEWQPVVTRDSKPLLAGQILRFIYWFEITFGWVAGLLLVAVVGNLVKKD
ncbi:MAG: hypothetical protein ACJ8EB_03145 [Allosphingosinicella sp.]